MRHTAASDRRSDGRVSDAMRPLDRVHPVVFIAMGRGDACRLLAAHIGGLMAERSGWLDMAAVSRSAMWSGRDLSMVIAKLSTTLSAMGVTGLQLPPPWCAPMPRSGGSWARAGFSLVGARRWAFPLSQHPQTTR